MKREIGWALVRLAKMRLSPDAWHHWEQVRKDWAMVARFVSHCQKVTTGCHCNLWEEGCHCEAEAEVLVQETLVRIDTKLLPKCETMEVWRIGNYVEEIARNVAYGEFAKASAQKRGGRKGKEGRHQLPERISYPDAEESEDQRLNLPVVALPTQVQTASLKEFDQKVRRLYYDGVIDDRELEVLRDLMEERTQREIRDRRRMSLSRVNACCKKLREILRMHWSW